MNNPYATYQSNALTTVPQEDILLQLLEGAILRIKQARKLNQEGEVGEARAKRSRVLEIVTELDNTLDRENEAQDVVENLDALYAYMIRQLNQATLEDDFEQLQPVQEVLEDLHLGFRDAVQEVKKAATEKASSKRVSKKKEAAVSARG